MNVDIYNVVSRSLSHAVHQSLIMTLLQTEDAVGLTVNDHVLLASAVNERSYLRAYLFTPFTLLVTSHNTATIDII